MSAGDKKLASSLLTGGSGLHFEEDVQASFVALMLAGGYAPCLPNWPIRKIKLQASQAGFKTEDFVVYCEEQNGNRKRRLLCNAKHGVKLTERDKRFGSVISGAWKDFNNPKVFTRGRGCDAFALITGPLTSTDAEGVRPLLEKARHMEGEEEFFQAIEAERIISEITRQKLKAFKSHLKIANSGKDVSRADLFEFLKHFHLLSYDLDIKAGVNIALLNTIISNGTGKDAAGIWGRIIVEVRSSNQNSGTISLDSLPEDLVEEFKKKVEIAVPPKFSISTGKHAVKKWANDPRANFLATACILGEWNEKSPGDLKIISTLSGVDLATWNKELRSIIQYEGSPIQLKNGHWKVKNRLSLWDELSDWIFDDSLDSFMNVAVEVLTEIDPRLEMNSEESESFSFATTRLAHSESLRRGLTGTLSYLGNRGDRLGKCTLHKAQDTSIIAVRKILSNSDSKIWGSLNSFLPDLAEAAPKEFLDAVEQALISTDNPFGELFSKEGSGVFGRSYMTGLLWALETLAWRDDTLVRSAELLAALAEIDPDGQWTNRPKNSLTTIFLPWFPQTLASFETQLVAVNTIKKEHPLVAWKLLLSLLPSSHAMSSGSHKPKWLELTEQELNPKVSVGLYWKQVAAYADLALDIAKSNGAFFKDLLGYIGHLPEAFQDQIAEFLVSNEASNIADKDLQKIWKTLVAIGSRHRRFSDADWSMSPERVHKLEMLAEHLAPKSPRAIHERLFKHDEFDLYEENGDWQKQRDKIHSQRVSAIQEIIADEGIDGVIMLSQTADSSFRVGYALGCISNSVIDDDLLSRFLTSQIEQESQFIDGYVRGRYHTLNWEWVDKVDRSEWHPSMTLKFLNLLPFAIQTWNRVEAWLGKDSDEYWKSVRFNGYEAGEDLIYAVDMLLKVGRPLRAVDCLYCRLHNKEPLDVERTVNALMSAVSSEEVEAGFDQYHLIELIESLQSEPKTSKEDLIRIEWAYLQLLGPFSLGKPITLEKELSSQPKFFCEVLRILYRSDKQRDAEKESDHENNTKNMASNAWHLLHDWSHPPGLNDEGLFSEADFNAWIKAVVAECEDTGHLDVGLYAIGEILFRCPGESDGSLWIVRAVASVLNEVRYDAVRRGFTSKAFNSRGVHTVDTTGGEDMKIADKWKEKAAAVEKEGFHRFAADLREFAKSYERDAERIRTTYSRDGLTCDDDLES